MWLRPESIAELTGLSEDQVRGKFADFSQEVAGRMNFVLRIRSEESALKIVRELEQLLCNSKEDRRV
jgi:hypothetical protein